MSAKPSLHQAAVPIALAVASSAFPTLTGGASLTSWLSSGAAALMGGAAGTKIRANWNNKRKAAALANAMLEKVHLARFTGEILGALVLEFASHCEKSRRRALLITLATRLPHWWSRLCDKRDPAAAPLRDPHFARSLASILAGTRKPPVVKWQTIMNLLWIAVLDCAPRLSFAYAPFLTEFLTEQISAGLPAALTSESAARPYRQALLRLHAEAITGIRKFTRDFHPFLESDVRHTDGLRAAIDGLRKPPRPIKKTARSPRPGSAMAEINKSVKAAILNEERRQARTRHRRPL